MMARLLLVAALLVTVMIVGLTAPAFAGQPDNPTARASAGSFNKSSTGLDHQSSAASEHDGPADPRVPE